MFYAEAYFVMPNAYSGHSKSIHGFFVSDMAAHELEKEYPLIESHSKASNLQEMCEGYPLPFTLFASKRNMYTNSVINSVT